MRFLLALTLLLAGCIDDISLPRCATVADCDAAAGYRLCHAGYCFRARPGEDLGGAGELAGSCAPPLGPRAGDACCPAWGGNALDEDEDCLAWSRELAGAQALRVVALPDAGAPVALVAAHLRAETSAAPVLRVVGLDAQGGTVWSAEPGAAEQLFAPVPDAGGELLVATGARLVRLRRSDGHELAQRAATLALPPVASPAGGALIADGEGRVLSLDPWLGERATLRAGGESVSRVAPLPEQDGEGAWLYDDAGALCALRPDAAPRWCLPLVPPSGAPLLRADDVLVAASEDGDIVLLRDEGASARVLARLTMASPARLFVPADDAHCFALSRAGELRLFDLDEAAWLSEGWPLAATSLVALPGALVTGGPSGLRGYLGSGEPELAWSFAEDSGVEALFLLADGRVGFVGAEGRITTLALDAGL